MGPGYAGRPWRGVLIPVAAALILFGIAIAAGAVFAPASGPWPYGPWFLFPWFWIFLLVFPLFLLLRFALWSRWGWGWGVGRWGAMDARDIAEARYARGEITREQFLALMRDLDQARTGGSPPRP